MDTRPLRHQMAIITAFAAVYLIWGSTYLAIRFAIETIPPFSMAAIRFFIAGLILFGWSQVRGLSFPSSIHWRSALIIGTLLLVSGNGLLSWAELFVPSGIAALIVGTVPVWMVVIDAVLSRTGRPDTKTCLGLLLGMSGIMILGGPREFGGAAAHGLGTFAVCVAAFSWALGSVYAKNAAQGPSTLQNVGMQMLLGSALLFVIGRVAGEQLDFEAISSRSAWALAYLIVLGGVVSYSAYVWLLKVSTPAKVSTYAYVNPVVAVGLGWGLGGEELSARVFLATAAVVGAVVLITSSKHTARSRRPATSTRLDSRSSGKR